ncbi:MAG: type II secretion system F family protein [Halobacteriales archaeon]
MTLERLPYVQVLYLYFGYLFRGFEAQYESLQEHLHGARMPTTYHGYLARTLLYALASFLGVLSLLVVLAAVYLRPVVLTGLNRAALFVGFVFPSAIVGYAVYRFRLYYPHYVANERGRAIELSLANVVNFLLALSRAGVPTGDTLEIISDHAHVLGEAAVEFRYAVHDMTYFGADVVNALDRLAETTPLLDLSEFIHGYVRALTGRGDIAMYLEDEMNQLFEQAELEQEEFLSRLGVLAEVYVAVFVALPIFALIILLVMGFVGGNVLTGIQIIVYAVIPLSALAYLVLLDIYMSSPLSGAGQHEHLETSDVYEQSLSRVPTTERDEDVTEQLDRLGRYQLRQRLARFMATPLTLMRRQPDYALAAGVAFAVLYVGAKTALAVVRPELPLVAPVPMDGSATDVLRAIDDTVVEGMLIALVVYGVFYELRARYLADIERLLPEFLNELSERHEVGISLGKSIQDMGARDMGRLNDEIDRMLRDLRLGSAATDVLRRFANRVRSPVVTRVVVLLTAASETAERLGPVIEALAERAMLAQRLNRERQVEMSLYVVIIYVAFFVFLVILAVLNDIFLPQIPQGGLGVGGFGPKDFDPVEYKTLFYHASVIQAVFGGLVGGKMSEGRVSAGVKHAVVMLLIAHVLFTMVLPNVAITL